MKKLITFLSLFLFIASAKAQPYKTMFPEGRKWVELITGLEPMSSVFQIEKDTIINAQTYKKVTGFWDLYFREDLNTGQVWIYFPNCTDSEMLYMDNSLQKGDTFTLVNPDITDINDSLEVVDTVYIKDGRKHIVFRQYADAMNEATTFIEGIGCNFGLLYQGCWGAVAADIYMLCVEDSGTNVYTNKYYNGACYPFGFPAAVNDIDPHRDLAISPNPANDILNISFLSGLKEIAYYSIVDISGREILAGKYIPGLSNYQLDVQYLNPGIYFLNVLNTHINEHIRFLKQ